ncbi:hypothetical protein PSAB6_620013 [Paraburkholderia sabiae]|nr:hypothetical protein PSAB6_620013 [Paraburkholderia sabiae]
MNAVLLQQTLAGCGMNTSSNRNNRRKVRHGAARDEPATHELRGRDYLEGDFCLMAACTNWANNNTRGLFA